MLKNQRFRFKDQKENSDSSIGIAHQDFELDSKPAYQNAGAYCPFSFLSRIQERDVC